MCGDCVVSGQELGDGHMDRSRNAAGGQDFLWMESTVTQITPDVTTEEILGLAGQEIYYRKPAPKKENSYQAVLRTYWLKMRTTGDQKERWAQIEVRTAEVILPQPKLVTPCKKETLLHPREQA